MVKSTGETIVGAAKFVGRAHMQVGLRFKWAANWITGADNTETNEMIAEVDAKQQEVIDQGLEVGKFLGTLLVDTATYLPKVELALLSGNMDEVKTALQGSETHRKVFSMVAEVLTKTAADLRSDSSRTDGQKGYIIGKIIFEVVSFIIPQTKVGKIMEMTKSQLLGKLIGKADALLPGARQRATATKAVCDAPGRCFMAGEQVVTKTGSKNIESIQPEDVVWSQNEYDPTKSGWKCVTAVQVSHPREIHHLTYELRGPPESSPLSPRAASGSSASVPLGASKSDDASQRLAPQTETLRVTGEHPFWVERGTFAGFMPVKALRRGDVFVRAGGGSAVLTAMRTERAPLGETFTTYNFTVEDYHTYFVGQAGIWVHNNCPVKMNPHLATRENIRSIIFQNTRPTQIEDLGRERFYKLVEAKGAMDKAKIELPTATWLTELWETNQGMFRDFTSTPKKIGLLPNGRPDLPSYAELRSFTKGNSRWAPGDGVDIHHSIDRWIQEEYLGLTGNFDDVPGFVIDTVEHTFGNGRGLPGTLTGDLIAAIKGNPNILRGDHYAVAEAMKKVYKARGLNDLWLVTHQTLLSKGITNLPVP